MGRVNYRIGGIDRRTGKPIYQEIKYERSGPMKDKSDEIHKPITLGMFLKMVIFFLLLTIVLGAGFILVMGWVRDVAFGDISNDMFWRNLWYDVTHAHQPYYRDQVIQFVRETVTWKSA